MCSNCFEQQVLVKHNINIVRSVLELLFQALHFCEKILAEGMYMTNKKYLNIVLIILVLNIIGWMVIAGPQKYF